MALKSAGGLTATTKAKALVYLKSQQQTSGGFEYTAGTGDSDPDSDALTIEGLLAVGEDPTSAAWSVGDKNALTDLLTFQYQNGGFGYFRPGANATAAPDAFSTTQPLVAIASRYLPVQPTAGAMPTTCPAAAPSTQPTPVPTPHPIVHLATTGASRIPQAGTLLLALAMLTVGWTLRRRAR
jgi:hypothetical protein